MKKSLIICFFGYKNGFKFIFTADKPSQEKHLAESQL